MNHTVKRMQQRLRSMRMMLEEQQGERKEEARTPKKAERSADGMAMPGMDGKTDGLLRDKLMKAENDVSAWKAAADVDAEESGGECVLTAREAEEYDTQRNDGNRGIDYDRIAEAASQRPVVVYVDRKAAAVLLSREMDTAIGNRNIRQLVSMGG